MTFGQIKTGTIFITNVNGWPTKCVKTSPSKARKFSGKRLFDLNDYIQVLTFSRKDSKDTLK